MQQIEASRDLPGLTPEEAAERLRTFGPNVLAPAARRSSVFGLIFALLADPMVLLLLVAGTTYLFLGDRFDAFVALGALVPIFLINGILEQRSERALEQLKKLSAPLARVRRGRWDLTIPATEIVPGDVMIVQEGDIVAADGDLLSGQRLILDESVLTGESRPVTKSFAAMDDGRRLLAGTKLLAGHGEVRVERTGTRTQYGRIGALMSEMHFTRTPIEGIIRRLVARIGAIVLVICAVVIVVEHSHGVLWPLAIIAGVSLAMAALPEELPMVYTLYLALGAWRLAKDKALVRRLASVETLGSTSVICVDKTGTLTEGRVEISKVIAAPGSSEREVVSAAALASESAGFDPLDAAVLRYAARYAADGAGRVLANEYPFDAAKRFAAKVWRVNDAHRLALKGAVEVVLDLCPLTATERARILAQNQELASTGMRVIAVAGAALPDAGAEAAFAERSLEFLGLLAFGDPIRAGVPQALAECRAAGIRVIMITGDHPATAQYVARAMGLAQETITGEELDGMSAQELEERIERTDIFARTRAEQKLQIVRALHARGLIVAMTGDGTNDALALREADIGIAMGENGTEVARAAADLVLLNDDFTTIVRAVEDGRRIFDNLGHAFRYLNAFHMPLLVSAFVIPFLGIPLLLLPVHLVLLELIVHPTSALVFENDPPDPDLMHRPPRPKDAGLLQKRDWIRPIVTGVLLSGAVLFLYISDLRAGDSVELARSTAIFAMIAGQTVLVLTERASSNPVWTVSLRDNPSILPILLGTLATLFGITYIPALDEALRLAPLSLHSVLTATGVALAASLLPEVTKLKLGGSAAGRIHP